MIPWDVVNDLRRLGRLGESRSAEALAISKRLTPFHDVNKQGWQDWNRVADALEIPDLVNLVRGLLLAEESLRRWSRGSVSGVIWAFHALERRDQEAARLVAEWGCDRTTNPWVPFRRVPTREIAARLERNRVKAATATREYQAAKCAAL